MPTIVCQNGTSFTGWVGGKALFGGWTDETRWSKVWGWWLRLFFQCYASHKVPCKSSETRNNP
jgi:hypothetical protein